MMRAWDGGFELSFGSPRVWKEGGLGGGPGFGARCGMGLEGCAEGRYAAVGEVWRRRGGGGRWI